MVCQDGFCLQWWDRVVVIREVIKDWWQQRDCSWVNIWRSELHKEGRLGQTTPRSYIRKGTRYALTMSLMSQGKYTQKKLQIMFVCVCVLMPVCGLMEHIYSRNRSTLRRSLKGTLQQMVWGHQHTLTFALGQYLPMIRGISANQRGERCPLGVHVSQHPDPWWFIPHSPCTTLTH